MNVPAAPAPRRRFLRGLIHTGLLLLLPCQLALLWVAHLDQPLRLPPFATEFLTTQLAQQGLALQARDLWLQPDFSLAAEDLTLSVVGIQGEVFTAARVELAAHPLRLGLGQLAVTRLRLSEAKLWSPASVALGGTRRPLIDRFDIELTREGRWLLIRAAEARAGKLSLHLSGEIPATLVRLSAAEEKAPSPLAPRLKHYFQQAERLLEVAEQAGGAKLYIQCAGQAGGTLVTAQTLLSEARATQRIGTFQLSGLELKAKAQLDDHGRLGRWELAGSAREVRNADWTTQTIDGRAYGTSAERTDWGADFVLHGATGLGWQIARAELHAQLSAKGTELTYQVFTPRSRGIGQALRRNDGTIEGKISEAVIHTEELRALPEISQKLDEAAVGLAGEIIGRGLAFEVSPEGRLTGLRGEVSCSGFVGLGLSAATIAPTESLPLRTRFDYNPGRIDFPLQLRDGRLGSVTGAADCSLRPGGPFILNLRGEIAPGCLDRVLGGWWISLWELFEVRARPYAFIEVEGHWGALQAITRGRVLLEKFTFLGAPFRRVEISVNADSAQTTVGLQRLEGGTSAADGSVEGTATWDWSKPEALAGPVVKLQGDLQPWIAARCAGKDFGEAVRGLRLSAGHRLALEVTPGSKQPVISTTLECDGDFSAWGIAGRGLRATTTNRQGNLELTARALLAGGTAQLSMKGDPLQPSAVELRLSECQPAQVGRLIAELNGTPIAAVADRPPAGRLDLNFKGSLDLKHPRLLRGVGQYELMDPELKKVRLLGGLSGILEQLSIGVTSYELTKAVGSFGCLQGRAYFPDMVVSGPESRLTLAGEFDLEKLQVHFEGDFAIPRPKGFNPLELLNLNRTLVGLTKIKVNGPISKPEISALPTLKEIIKSRINNNLGKIPPELLE